MKPPSYLHELLQRYQHDQCTPEERQLVEQWYQELGQQQAPDFTPGERAQLKARLWNQIAQQTIHTPQAAPQRGPWWHVAAVRWAAAAVLLLGGVLSTLLFWKQPNNVARHLPTFPAPPTTAWVNYLNTNQKATTIQLQDGSTVQLSPASRLRYPRQFAGPNRRVYLTGEATFDVQHNAAQPFLVFTDKVVTTVLGTRFTVKAYAGQKQVSVLVKRGKVRVSPRPSDAATAVAALPASVVVRPNQQAVYEPGARELKKELVAEPAMLVPQSLSFDDRPVPEVMLALEQAYGVDIRYDEQALANCTVSLTLKDGSLFERLAIICKTLNASYELSDTQILVHSTGCKS